VRGRRAAEGTCRRPAACAAGSAAAGIPSRSAAVFDAAARTGRLPRHARLGLGINGRYLGPTIRVWNGDDVKLIYSNRLTENVAMTIRGLQVPGPLIGGAARMMSPNADWAPVLPIRQSAATLWYQANTPNHMAKQVYNGLAGMWLVEDEVSKNLPIPNHYGVDDFPVIIQDKRLDNFGTPEYSEPAAVVSSAIRCW
jgi:suppressor of ftsI